MKTIFTITALASLTMASSTHANTAWVESPLWKAPQETNFTLKLKGKERLAAECESYKKAVFKPDGTLTSIAQNPKRLQDFRNFFEPMVIEVDQKTWPRLEKTLSVTTSIENDSEKLPYYTQKESVTGLLLENAQNLKVSGYANSYTEVSKKAGLEVSMVSLSHTMTGTYFLKFLERDVACDLYEGIASVTIETPTYVALTDNSVTTLTEFYDDRLLPELNGVLSLKSELLTHKAARIGYRTGKVLEDEFTGLIPEKAEKQIREVMQVFLNTKTLEISPILFRSDSRLLLDLETRIEGNNVQVNLEF